MDYRFETLAIHLGEEPDLWESGDVVAPIHLSSTFAQRGPDEPPRGYRYSRIANPTRDVLERKLAALEGAKYALAFSSGMAAETAVLTALLKPGDHMIAFEDLYGGTKRVLDLFGRRYGVEISFVDATKVENVLEAFTPRTRLIWLESPTNPLLKLCDLEAIAKEAHRRDVKVVVDNTFATPYFQNPLRFGVDVVVHSTTKYINGHSDCLGGAVVLSDGDLYEELSFIRRATGGVLSPFDSYLTLRGLKTLAVRMRQHQENAMRIAEFLEGHPKVIKVHYPGLKSHPQHELAKKQMRGFGGMLSFEIKGGAPEAQRFIRGLKLFLFATSLGGVESLVNIPAKMSHDNLPPEERKRLGIGDNLIRLSVGIENAEDLIGDLERALREI
ncbi:MAG: cystathionine gamma-synthase [Deltaproteobacteria bacterium]|nr:MAG: cystathionine gamma-synthase [Deltaproteobacteria bacterium]